MNNSENFKDCWAVFGELGAEDYDDRRARVSVVGAFAYPCNAEDFSDFASRRKIATASASAGFPTCRRCGRISPPVWARAPRHTSRYFDEPKQRPPCGGLSVGNSRPALMMAG